MSKKGFLLGVVLGGAAIATAVTKLDDEQKAALKAKAQQGFADLKDRAIDYAFYANDAAEDFKVEASQQFADAKDKVADFADQYQAAKGETADFGSSLDQATDSLRSELAKVSADEEADEDIVIDGGAAYNEAATEEADQTTDTETVADTEATDEQPEK